MRRIAIILYGSPGSGKGMQAELLAKRYGLIHFDTGRYLETVVHDPERQREALVKRERKFFDTGFLMTPSFVFREVARGVRRIARSGMGLVLSGSPRTLYEAERLIPMLEKLYGKEHIYIVILKVPAAAAATRNVNRIVCSVCRAPLLTKFYPSSRPAHCPVCAGPFYKRTLDNAEAIEKRFKEYEERTKPIFALVRGMKYRLFEVSGAPPPYRVFQKIVNHVEWPGLKRRKNLT